MRGGVRMFGIVQYIRCQALLEPFIITRKVTIDVEWNIYYILINVIYLTCYLNVYQGL